MSTDLPKGRIALGDLVDRKGRRRILMSGAYTAPFARTLDRFVDVLLVDREVARAIHGFHSTADATLDMMVLHGQAVMRGSDRAAVLIELPTGTYESTSDRALHDAELLVEATGCAGVAVPIEVETIEVIRVLVDNAIPVLGIVEVGDRAALTGSDDPDWLRIQTTRNVQAAVGAGAFGILAFGSDDTLLEELTRSLRIPVLGTESAGVCDGQYLNDTEFLSMISAIKTASRTRPAPREAKPAVSAGTAAPNAASPAPARATPASAGTSPDPATPRRVEPVPMRSTPPGPPAPPVRTEPSAPRTPLPTPVARAPVVPPARKMTDPIVPSTGAPPPALAAAPALKSPIASSRPAGAGPGPGTGLGPAIPPRPAPTAARPLAAPEAAAPLARARPPVAAPGSRPPTPSARTEADEVMPTVSGLGATAPLGTATSPPLGGIGSAPPRTPPMRSPVPSGPLPPTPAVSGPPAAASSAPATEPARAPMPTSRAPAPTPPPRAPAPMPASRSVSPPETRPPAAESVTRPEEMEVTIPVKMPPARTRRPTPAVAEETERATATVSEPAAEPTVPVRTEVPEEEPTRLIVPEAPPVEEVTSSRIAWTGPPKPEKQTLFGALRGRLKSTPRVVAIGIGLAAASAGLGLVLSRTAADVERVDADLPRVERAG